jgi:WXG100 family type VII secretion target
MVQFRVRAESLEEVARLMQAVITTFDAHVGAVDAKVNSVVDASWRGADADTFRQGWQQFDAASAEVRTALTGLSLALQNAAMAYNTTEGAIDRSVKPNSGGASAALGVKK